VRDAEHAIFAYVNICQKRGRPAIVRYPMIGLRAAPTLRRAIEDWAKTQPDEPSLSDAIGRLVELGLKSKK
jgi:hypothetical protein